MQCVLWYWKNPKFLHGDVPYPYDFHDKYNEIWRGELPKTCKARKLLTIAGYFFEVMNLEPETLVSQDTIRTLGEHAHTSMSVGDIVQVDDNLLLCLSQGWASLLPASLWLGEKKGGVAKWQP